jgi:hypothetical protein
MVLDHFKITIGNTKYLRMQGNQYVLGDLSFKLKGLLWRRN